MRPTRRKDLTGRRFGRLVVQKYAYTNKRRRAMWRCRCDCGGEIITQAGLLTHGETKSCGCLGKERVAAANRRRLTKHGETAGGNSRTYRIWSNMISRCGNPNFDAYPYYGGRGISVCTRWKKFANFLEDMGRAPERKSLDRIDSNGNYCLENCRWVSKICQANNKRNSVRLTIDGETKTVAEWSREDGAVGVKTIYARVSRGWGAQESVFKPVAAPRRPAT